MGTLPFSCPLDATNGGNGRQKATQGESLAAMSGRQAVAISDDEARADHRLTAENVRQMFAVERELLKLS